MVKYVLTLNKKLRFSADDLELYSEGKYSALRVLAAKKISEAVTVHYEKLLTEILNEGSSFDVFQIFLNNVYNKLYFKGSCGASDTASRDALWVLIEPYKQEAEKIWVQLHDVASAGDDEHS